MLAPVNLGRFEARLNGRVLLGWCGITWQPTQNLSWGQRPMLYYRRVVCFSNRRMMRYRVLLQQLQSKCSFDILYPIEFLPCEQLDIDSLGLVIATGERLLHHFRLSAHVAIGSSFKEHRLTEFQ